MTKRNILLTLLPLLIISLLLSSPSLVHASLFDDFIKEMNGKLQGGVDNLKSLVTPTEKVKDKVLTIDASIVLVPDGDINKNGEIDAGDTITFIYNIQNNTDKKYAYATLKTNIQRDSLNFIHNVTGVTGLKDDGKTIEFPNLRVEPGMVKVISFDANINYFTEDKLITSEPEFLTEDNKSVTKSSKKEIKATRLTVEGIESLTGPTIKRDKEDKRALPEETPNIESPNDESIIEEEPTSNE